MTQPRLTMIQISVVWPTSDDIDTTQLIAEVARNMEASVSAHFKPFLAPRKAVVKALVIGTPSKWAP